MQEKLLEIKNLFVETASDGKKILNGISFDIEAGKTYAIMGPNGSGKTTLVNVLSGNDAYRVTGGEIIYRGKNLLDLEPEIRAREGIFAAFQYPVEIPGVSNLYFLKTALNAKRAHQNLPPLDAMDFYEFVKEKLQTVKMGENFLNRSVNVGFSGGEKKRNEVLQMAVLEPSLCILDETDSGLDIDAMRVVADGVNALRKNDRAFLVITHYQRLLDYIIPDVVHILINGEIADTGDAGLAQQLEKDGYRAYRGEETGIARKD
ncbi:MAG: Fe-S cluster assembly ATPase SufC [Cardiobacteriaceae bacterium]|nr:Fe-S cluster assembly ATPase SufC [Cardiobacteriaceae bacterium]